MKWSIAFIHVRILLTRLVLTGLVVGPAALGGEPNRPDAWRADFVAPPLALKSQPLWHLNGTLTPEGIAEQLQDSRDKSGFAGVAVLPVTATEPPYLSEAYFERYGQILETCQRLGMKVIFYDDINYPSGTAGKRMPQRFPDHTACRLDKWELQVTGPLQWDEALPAGIFMGAVAMHGQDGERRDISAAARDRLFQMDFMRRAARGRLAEMLGADALSSDVSIRTVFTAQAPVAAGLPDAGSYRIEDIITSTNNAKYDVMAGARLNFIENRVIPLCRRLEAEESVTVKAIDPEADGWFDVEDHPVLTQARAGAHLGLQL